MLRFLVFKLCLGILAAFFLRDAVRLHRCSICYGNVAVCVSVTLMYCAQTTESIIYNLYQIVAQPF